MCNLLFNGRADESLSPPELRGRVKLVYMDPPYNTGKKFAQYSDRSPLKDWLAMMESALAAEGAPWELCVSTGGVFSPVARGLSREQASRLHDRLAVRIDAEELSAHSRCIGYAAGELTAENLD
ncbi:site-specific DNA-methyltransferase [Arthrobacter sp. E918]|uniref:Site-specific DNA-methyltransferase n=2 Tax=Arthrobacter mobilis TaxID=2724944 RepID=A0A7X6K6T7_9MICC|nr:site-specific DNA-methyltransferase [Arthrobacter mobilis]